jgi:hypothetical protein
MSTTTVSSTTPRRFLVIRYDTTGLTDDEVAALTGEALAQAADSDVHPDVDVTQEVEVW